MALRTLAVLAFATFAKAQQADPLDDGSYIVHNECISNTGTNGFSSFDRDGGIEVADIFVDKGMIPSQLPVNGEYNSWTLTNQWVTDATDTWGIADCSTETLELGDDDIKGYYQSALDNCDLTTTTDKWGNNMLIQFTESKACYQVSISLDQRTASS